MKKFKSRKRKKYIVLKCILFALLIYFVCYITLNKLLEIKINSSLVEMTLNESNRSLGTSLIDKIANFFNSITPTTLLDSTINAQNVSSDNYDEDSLTQYINDPNPIDVSNPLVYIYNTHQLEGYDNVDSSEYNIIPNVQMAAYLLKDKLNNNNIPTIVETGSINDLLVTNGWSYAYSYKASRYFIEDTLNKYKDLKLIIDLHRDSISHDASTVEYNNKKYAKVLFVVGTDYDYNDNLELANTLNDLINLEAPISRGVIEKGGVGVNGIYNQDLNKNMVLIECGGNENSLDEVINTIEVISNVIIKYLGE